MRASGGSPSVAARRAPGPLGLVGLETGVDEHRILAAIGAEEPTVRAERVPIEDVLVHLAHATGPAWPPRTGSARWRRTLAPMERHIVFYDEDCGFCRWSVDRLLRWDRRGLLRATPIQGEEADRLLTDLREEDRLASWHLVAPDGGRYSGGAAAGPLARLLPAGAPSLSWRRRSLAPPNASTGGWRGTGTRSADGSG